MKQDFVIENGSLIKYVGDSDRIAVPYGVTVIKSSAFSGNKNIRSVYLPESVTRIEAGAFQMCQFLDTIEINGAVEKIESETFYYNSQLRNVILPRGLKEIGKEAFCRCRVLEDLELPDSLERIEDFAFSFCSNLANIEFPPGIKEVGMQAFVHCSQLKTIKMNGLIKFGFSAFSECDSLNTDNFDHKTLLYFYLNYSKGKAYEACKAIIGEDLENNAGEIMRILSGSGKKDMYEKLARLLISFKDSVSNDLLEKTRTFFEKEKANSSIKLLVKNGMIEADEETKAKREEEAKKEAAEAEKRSQEDALKLERGERPDEKEAEDLAAEYLKKNSLNEECRVSDRCKVYYKNSSKEVKPEVLGVLLNEYILEWNRNKSLEYGSYNEHEELNDGTKVRISKLADRISSYLDEESLNRLLNILLSGTKYRKYVLPFARFASQESVESAIRELKRKRKGQAKDRYWANNVEEALYISDTAAAAQFFDENRKLDAYAKMRNVSSQEIRDLYMTPDFGFDEKGRKELVCGDVRLYASVLPNLSVQLYSEDQGKVLKSFPRSGADPNKLQELKAEYDQFKKDVKAYAISKVHNINRIHVSKEAIKKDIWEKKYLADPIISVISSAVVWTDQKKCFVVCDGVVKDENGREYVPEEKIYAANVTDMSKEEISIWQTYFLDNKIVQPFEQVWEPVVSYVPERINERYKGLHLTSQDRNSLKKAMKIRGIDVYSDSMEAEFDHRHWSYEFYDYNMMHFGNYMDVKYAINQDKSITFESIILSRNATKEAINAILFEFDKLAIQMDISADRSDLVSEERLDMFTLSQIISFIDLAEKNGSINVSTILLNYKNMKYSDYNYLEELSLNL